MKWVDLEPYVKDAVVDLLYARRKLLLKSNTNSHQQTEFRNALKLAIEHLETEPTLKETPDHGKND